MTLEVLICTYGDEGIKRVAKMGLPRVNDVKYLISWQTNVPNSAIPEELFRDDVLILTTSSTGLSNNRNHSIANATGDICLIADDDLTYTSHQLQCVIGTFERNPDVDIALFRYSGGDNKAYPDYEFDLCAIIPKGYYITSFEIAFRRQRLSSGVRFDPRFGVGASMPAGEEYLFVQHALKAGLRCRFFPETITHHEGLTTGSRQQSMGVLQANGVCIAVGYGLLGLLRLPVIAWRHCQSGNAKFFPVVYNLLKGYIYGKRHF